MDPNTLLLWLAILSSLSLVWRSLRPGSILFGWAAVGLILILSTALTWWRHPQYAGYVGGGVWFALVFLPMLLRLSANRFSISQRYGAASLFAHLAAAIHPLDGFVQDAQLAGALAQWQRGNLDRARASLDHLTARHSHGAVSAQCYRLRIDHRWNDIALWLSTLDIAPMLAREPSIFSMYIRSLGESGQTEHMLEEYYRLLPLMHAPQARHPRLMAQLFALALGGRSHAVKRIIAANRQIGPRIRAFWQATADSVASDAGAAATFQALANEPHQITAPSAAYRLQSPLTPAQYFSPRTNLLLDHLENDLAHEALAHFPAGRRKIPWATWALIAANVIMFFIEIHAGGSENDAVLDKLGAMDTDSLLRHQYWRLIAANFLHYGIAHITMNMLALFVLGPFVEFAFGIRRYLLIYSISGIGAMAGTIALGIFGWVHSDSLVGASGAIMGLVGATGAILLLRWFRFRTRDVKNRLFNIVLIVILQVIFDAMTPLVSSSAHLVGLTLGFALGMILAPRQSARAAF